MCDKCDSNNFMFFHTDHHECMDFKFMHDFCYLDKPYCFFSEAVRPNFKVFSRFLPQKINLKFIQNYGFCKNVEFIQWFIQCKNRAMWTVQHACIPLPSYRSAFRTVADPPLPETHTTS